MSRKTIILTAVILAVLLIGAAIGYKTLTARRDKTPAQDTGQTVSYSPKAESGSTEEQEPEEAVQESSAVSEISSTSTDNESTVSETDSTSSDTGSIPEAAEASDADDNPGASEEDLPLAPDFTVYTMDGTEVHLSDFRGKPAIVNFWASWCPPCKAELPDFHDLYKEYGDQIEFLMVNLTDGSQETRATASAFLLQTGYTFPVYLDLESSAAYAYGLYSIPVTVAVDEDGVLMAQRLGSMGAEEILEILDLLLE